jgi:hypothetical protein
MTGIHSMLIVLPAFAFFVLCRCGLICPHPDLAPQASTPHLRRTLELRVGLYGGSSSVASAGSPLPSTGGGLS